MSKLPRQIDRRIRERIQRLPVEWQVVKKRDHYFLWVGGGVLCCVGDNSSKVNEHLVRRTADTLDRILVETGAHYE